MLQLLDYFKEHHIKVTSLQRRSENKWYSADACATIEIYLGKRILHQLVIEDIKKLDGVRYVEEL